MAINLCRLFGVLACIVLLNRCVATIAGAATVTTIDVVRHVDGVIPVVKVFEYVD
ncbi:MAG: hypothetical protein MAG794_00046 [Gammaproteobacteria bacterium]|nr:hypothetical protein [Gammaproteobacteria bacterium]